MSPTSLSPFLTVGFLQDNWKPKKSATRWDSSRQVISTEGNFRMVTLWLELVTLSPSVNWSIYLIMFYCFTLFGIIFFVNKCQTHMGIFSNVIFLSLRTGPIIVRVYFFTKSITRNETARFGIRVKCLFSEFQFELSGKVALPILLVPYGPYDMGLYWLNLHFQLPKKAMNHSGWKWNSAGKQKAEIHVSKNGNSAASAEFYFQPLKVKICLDLLIDLYITILW